LIIDGGTVFQKKRKANRKRVSNVITTNGIERKNGGLHKERRFPKKKSQFMASEGQSQHLLKHIQGCDRLYFQTLPSHQACSPWCSKIKVSFEEEG